MDLDHIPVDAITEQHLLALIQAPETRSLEFKLEWVGSNDAERKEFLKDVSAMANTAGGHIVYGVREERSAAAEIVGFELQDPDKEQRGTEESLQKNIQPPIIGARVQPVLLSNGKYAMVVRIPRSWNGPHRTDFKGSRRFYARNSSAVYEPEVQELRQMFMAGSVTEERARGLHAERVTAICHGAAAMPLFRDGKLIIHVIPKASLFDETQIDVARVFDFPNKFVSPRNTGFSKRLNYNGVLIFESAERGSVNADWYTQVYRSGVVEFVYSGIVDSENGQREFLASYVEKIALSFIFNTLDALNGLVVNPPYLVLTTLHGTADAKMQMPRGVHVNWGAKCDQDKLALPLVLFERPSLPQGWQSQYKFALDVMWNAFGFKQSLFFDANGEWNPRT